MELNGSLLDVKEISKGSCNKLCVICVYFCICASPLNLLIDQRIDRHVTLLLLMSMERKLDIGAIICRLFLFAFHILSSK